MDQISLSSRRPVGQCSDGCAELPLRTLARALEGRQPVVLKSGLLWQSMLSTCMPRQGLQREVCTSFSVGPSSCYVWFSEPRPWVEPRPWLLSALSAACNLAEPCSGSSSSLSFFRGFALCLHVYSKRSFQQARPSLTRRCPSSYMLLSHPYPVTLLPFQHRLPPGATVVGD